MRKTTPERILVADDESLVATGLANSLIALGFVVVGPVTDGQAALDAAERDGPDLAVLDIKMPPPDGLEVAKRLWEARSIPSIIVSAFADRKYIEQAQATGVFGYLLKPVGTESLRIAVSIAWSRASSHTEQHNRIDQLETSLANRRVVEQAKWRLTELHGVSESEAHGLLQKTARNTRRKLLEVAEAVLRGEETCR
ncbi:MAG: response regulator [Phycisphaerales bacterium]|nr:response regulator [Phycisphaerales bacterium]